MEIQLHCMYKAILIPLHLGPQILIEYNMATSFFLNLKQAQRSRGLYRYSEWTGGKSLCEIGLQVNGLLPVAT